MPPTGILATIASYLTVPPTVCFRFGQKIKEGVKMPLTYEEALALARSTFEELHDAPPDSLVIFLERDGHLRNLLRLDEHLWNELSDSREPYYAADSIIYVHINTNIWRDGPRAPGVRPLITVDNWYRPLEERGGAYGVAQGEPEGAAKARAFKMFREFSPEEEHRAIVAADMAKYIEFMKMAGPDVLNMLR